MMCPIKAIGAVRGWFREQYRAYRHRSAERLRRQVKLEIMKEDARDFFAGKKTTEESLAWRDYAYRRLDEMSDEEILG